MLRPVYNNSYVVQEALRLLDGQKGMGDATSNPEDLAGLLQQVLHPVREGRNHR